MQLLNKYRGKRLEANMCEWEQQKVLAIGIWVSITSFPVLISKACAWYQDSGLGAATGSQQNPFSVLGQSHSTLTFRPPSPGEFVFSSDSTLR